MKSYYVCPHCNKAVRKLKQHIDTVHTDLKEPEPKSKGQTLTLDIKAKPEPKKEVGHYHCVDCGTGLNKGQNPCPGCGAMMDWSQV